MLQVLFHPGGVRALVVLVVLLTGVPPVARSADQDAETGDTRASDRETALRAGDDVGGSFGAALFFGRMTDASLVDVVKFQYNWADADLISADLSYTLKKDNPFQKFMDPVLHNIDVAFNVTYQDDPTGTIWVFSPYVMARWNRFPWSDTLRTTFGLGGGLSYATSVPAIEFEPTKPDGDYDNLLHYIAIEATLALPKHKDWHLVYRLHHRSGVFGLMGADNSGNTAVQIGVRHFFK